MAVYENLDDDDDRLTTSWRSVQARAQELMDIREMVLSGDPEQVSVPGNCRWWHERTNSPAHPH